MSNNTQVMRDLLNDKKKLKDLKYIQNYSPQAVCTMYNNKNSALVKYVNRDANLSVTASALDGYCGKTTLSKKEKGDVTKIWTNLVQMIKSPRATPVSVPNVPARIPNVPARIPNAPEPVPNAPEPAPNVPAVPQATNSIMNAIGTLERDLQTLKARVLTWEGAGGRRRQRHTRRQRGTRR